MTVSNYTTSIVVNKTAGEVFDAINNARGWWQGEIEGITDRLNEVFTYRMEDIHFSTQKIVEFILDEKVVWQVMDCGLNFLKDKAEWTGTQISFDITAKDKQTEVRFTHHGLVPSIECYDVCSGAWEQIIQKSLFNFITTGKGSKVFG
ncbi:MAG: SRPBCC domain-containing protein [Chitinophagaceae bacterium]|jgi:hypothetical protein